MAYPYGMSGRAGMGRGGAAALLERRRRASLADMVSTQGVLRVIAWLPLGRDILAKKLGWNMM